MEKKYMDSMGWRVHVPNLLNETLINKGTWILNIPFQIFGRLLFNVGEIAARINDPELNEMMCRLTIYSIADPTSSDYDDEAVKEISKLAKESRERRLKSKP